MSKRYIPLSVEIAAPTTVGTASDVSTANVVRTANTAGATAYLVTLVDANGTTTGSFTLLPLEVMFLDKSKTSKVFAGNAAVKLTSVSYPA
jgi:hypothetical protein